MTKEELDSKGFCIINDVFLPQEIEEFKKIFQRCENHVHDVCRTHPPDPYEYIQLFEKETIVDMQSYCEDSIIETAKGRYDVRTEKVKQEFKMIPETPIISNLMKECLQSRYLCDIGILVTNAHSTDGPWHRDTYNLNGPSNPDGSYDDSLVMKLNPFYYTCLIPLNDITEANGRTEFIQGSHRLTWNEAKGKEWVKHNVKAGSIVVFDGRMFHRACAHPSNHPRQMIYLVFHRDWYVDV